jgi:hypothetical protein
MSVKKNSFESQVYNKSQFKYNYLNRYDKDKEYRLKKSYSLRPFSTNIIYGNKNDNLNIFEENPLYPYSNSISKN